MKHVDTTGLRIAYDVHGGGGGVPLVLIHAFPFDRSMWDPQVGVLAGTRRVVAVDLRGFGGSATASDGAMERMAEDVRAVVEAEFLGPSVIGGLSMGGYVAMAYLRKYPMDVAGLVLANTRPGSDTDAARKGRLALIDAVREHGMQAVVDAMFGKMLSPAAYASDDPLVEDVRERMLGARPDGVIAALAGMAVRGDSTDLLTAVAVPTLLIAGTEDTLIPHDDMARMASLIERARLVSLEGAGHLSNLEAPGAFTSAVADFLAGLDA